jgi:hypothetical protein
MESKNVIFIHIALLDGWYERLSMYLFLIKTSGLLSKVDNIYLCFVGDNSISKLDFDNTILEKIIVKRVDANLNTFEVPTQKLLYDFCCINKNCNVLYIHTKGVGKEINLCIEDWITYMLYFLVEKHNDVLDLLKTYNTVGVDLREEPTLHYSGNFWWTKSSHISSLPDPLLFKDLSKYPNPLNSERHNQEFWICHIRDKNYSMWDCGINCYERHLHRYSPDLYRES